MADLHTDDLLAEQLEAIGRGEIAGLHEFYKATSQRLFVICLGIVNTRDGAEDVLQEVYLKVWNRAAGFDRAKGPAWPWLAIIARNAAIDWMRARSRIGHLDGEKYLITRANEIEGLADEQLVQAQESERAMREIAHLEEAAAQCVRAVFLEGLSYSEVAEREGLPIGTVKSRIRRALKLLRLRMSDG